MRFIANGGFGRIYKVNDNMVRKTIDKDINCDSIVTEIDIMSRLRHPNIVNFIDVSFNDNGDANIYMELCIGDLDDLIARNPLNSNQFMNLYHGIGSAVSFIHSQNIIHLDIKTNNILYKLVEGDIVFKLSDFGLSSYVEFDSISNYSSVNARPPENFISLVDDDIKDLIISKTGVDGERFSKKTDSFSFGMLLLTSATSQELLYVRFKNKKGIWCVKDYDMIPSDTLRSYLTDPKKYLNSIYEKVDLSNEIRTIIDKYLVLRYDERQEISFPQKGGYLDDKLYYKDVNDELKYGFAKVMSEFIENVVNDGDYVHVRTIFLTLDIAARYLVLKGKIPNKDRLKSILETAGVIYENDHEYNPNNASDNIINVLNIFGGKIVRNTPFDGKNYDEIKKILDLYMRDVNQYLKLETQSKYVEDVIDPTIDTLFIELMKIE